MQNPPDKPDGRRSTVVQMCTFMIREYLCGLRVTDVQEILRSQELTPVPLAPEGVCGLLNLRGDVVTAIDLRQRLRLEVAAEEAEAGIVVARHEGIAIALLVDEIGDVLELSEADFEPPPPTLNAAEQAYFEGVFQLQEGLLLALNLNAIVWGANTAGAAIREPDSSEARPSGMKSHGN